jgi:hypothetical protein
MSTPKPDPNRKKQPTADDLAGTPVCKEEDQPTMRVRGSGGVRVRGRGAPAAPLPAGPPTADDLAGIPVCAEGEEDLTVRPRERRRQP